MEPSKIRIENNICYIEVYNEKGEVLGEALIDTEDIDKIKGYRFHLNRPLSTSYMRVYNNKRQTLHYLITGSPPKGKETDHRNRNPLDNRRQNLRPATRSQSNMNRAKSLNKSSIYKGVSWNKNLCKWEAYINLNKKRTNLGYFYNENDAGKVYNKAAKKLFGEYACLNIIKERI